MARYLHKSWQDKRSGFTRRVRWFQGDRIRLEFITPERQSNQFFGLPDEAQTAYDKFVATGEIPGMEGK